MSKQPMPPEVKQRFDLADAPGPVQLVAFLIMCAIIGLAIATPLIMWLT